MTCPKTKSATHCLTDLFSIRQNKHWTIRRRDNRFVDQSSHCILFKIVGFLNTSLLLLSYCFFFKAFNLVDNASLVFFARFSLQQQSNCPLPVYTQTFAEMKLSVKRPSDDINCAIKKVWFFLVGIKSPLTCAPCLHFDSDLAYTIVYLTNVCWPIWGTTWQ